MKTEKLIKILIQKKTDCTTTVVTGVATRYLDRPPYKPDCVSPSCKDLLKRIFVSSHLLSPLRNKLSQRRNYCERELQQSIEADSFSHFLKMFLL